MKPKLWIFFLIAGLICSNALSAPALYSWIQANSQGTMQVRSIVQNSSCPAALIDGKRYPLQIRAQASKHFPITICELSLPKFIKNIRLDSTILAIPKLNPQRIAIIGDTGCRLRAFAPIQACNDPKKWPFEAIAKQIAHLNPDLIIHVGDYYYREMICPKGNTECQGSPVGDQWLTWEAEFFKPASSVLPKAPWIFTRGNHELCHRGGQGFSRLLDGHFFETYCQNETEPYLVETTNLNLLVLDNANYDFFHINPKQKDYFKGSLEKLKAVPTKNNWLIFHKPLRDNKHLDTFNEDSELTELLNQVQLMLSGHFHNFSGFSFNNGIPPQVIVGNSGSHLDNPGTPVSELKASNKHLSQGIIINQFGFAILEKTPKNWIIKLYNPEGKQIVFCKILNNQVNCIQE